MQSALPPSPDHTSFIARWRSSGAAERANYALFLSELCDLIGAERPNPASDTTKSNAYTFERAVTLDETGANGFIDLYKQSCFVLEAKQGSDAPEETEGELLGVETLKRRIGTAKRGTRSWDVAMQAARQQAYRYARALPDSWPPFIIVVDVGYCIDLYADFSGQGKAYQAFPDQQRYRIMLEDLAIDEVRDTLRAVWNEPQSLNPALRSARVTRALAGRLARLATSLEGEGHEPDEVAQFLMRCLFSMFAEDVGLLPKGSFTGLLETYREGTAYIRDALEHLWRLMDKGGFAPELHTRLLQFNGGLFKDARALPLSAAQLELLIEAAEADWKEVEPAIFGTLLERALDPEERHALGAHYTPRAYVERLVMPTVVEPLREEWTSVQAAAILKESAGDEAGAREEIVRFHRRLCSIKVLDPACGSGNFLYVTLEHLKRLEGEVVKAIDQYPGQKVLDMSGGLTVTPEQFLGLEINPRAAAVTDVVLWIGYLQWHFRTYGHARRLDPPILREYRNIRHQDALLAVDGAGETVKAEWPKAEFIVGNPPFIGPALMRQALGDSYTEAVRRTYAGEVPDSSDFVMYWWHKAAVKVRTGEAERFGFIATNSLRQTFNRRIVAQHLEAEDRPLSLVYAIPDHPWVDSQDGADVRISMTVGIRGKVVGRVAVVTDERQVHFEREVMLDEHSGFIAEDLTIGVNVSGANALKANIGLTSRGMMLFGSGFIVKPEKASTLGLGQISGLERHIRPYRNGRDLTARPRDVMVIDLFGLQPDEVRKRFPEVFQHVYEQVKPERDKNRDRAIREAWWLHGRTRSELRSMLAGLPRYIVTVETSKHRFFQFLDSSFLPDNKLISIASEDAYVLGILSGRTHIVWALGQGSRLGVGNDPVYLKTRCFETFPFPVASDAQKVSIRVLGEELDAHRKARMEAHPGLTMTDMYNVLEKLRAGETLSRKEKTVHEHGLVSVLKDVHDELDAAVAEAYGWPEDLSDEEILYRLVALNKERAEEEKQGLIRWLRPEYQAKDQVVQGDLQIETSTSTETADGRIPWPDDLSAQIQAVQRIVAGMPGPVTPEQVARGFEHKILSAKRLNTVTEVLTALEALGLVRSASNGTYSA